MNNPFIEFLLDLLFPPKCVFCHKLLKTGEHGFCAHCQTSLPWTSTDDRPRHYEGISQCESPLWYRGDVPDSFHRYKFEGCSSYAAVYGPLMVQCARDRLDGRFDLITWAPLSAKRKKKRGYDQAFLLARSMGNELGLQPVETLRKCRDTSAQSSLDDDERRKTNVHGVYQCTDPSLIEGKRVLLVDDVVTTGSTLSECARTLRAAGAADVVAVTLARARK